LMTPSTIGLLAYSWAQTLLRTTRGRGRAWRGIGGSRTAARFSRRQIARRNSVSKLTNPPPTVPPLRAVAAGRSRAAGCCAGRNRGGTRAHFPLSLPRYNSAPRAKRALRLQGRSSHPRYCGLLSASESCSNTRMKEETCGQGGGPVGRPCHSAWRPCHSA
jgi:hypothetical protein